MNKQNPAPSPTEELETGEMPAQQGEQVQVTYQPLPATAPPTSGVPLHKVIPPVPEGEAVTDETPSSPVELD
jgi:hypothetical protein